MPNVGHRNVEVLKQFESEQINKEFIFCGVVYKEPEREKFLKDLAATLSENKVQYQYYGCFEQPGVYGSALLQRIVGKPGSKWELFIEE